ncbi:MAG: 3-deoxy-7-phosphoheptulonate synthase [Gemmatimonadetes bacterium]|nr:3-deoxy-7-phosphoheptulonate synthase [Gemmatimonadota bacterium]
MSDTPLVARSPHREHASTAVVGGAHQPDARDVTIGDGAFVIAAGPCSVEDRAMIHESARAVAAGGARLLRGGALKPRTSPYAFQGLGTEGLELLATARAATGLPVVTEVLDVRQVELIARYADVLQIGARNMYNTPLLAAVGELGLPVLLKRSFAATIRELISAAEYIAVRGNTRIILCERGIRTFESSTRNTLDVAAIPVLKRETHLPVLVDPSHAAGRAELVAPLACAALAAGADGLIVEVHPTPCQRPVRRRPIALLRAIRRDDAAAGDDRRRCSVRSCRSMARRRSSRSARPPVVREPSVPGAPDDGRAMAGGRGRSQGATPPQWRRAGGGGFSG